MESVQKYIREGEHQTQDFKFRIDDAKKIARTLSAFANTDGGRLLIGVKDNGKITGINPEEEYHMIEGAADMYCKPPVKFESQVWQEGHKLVLEINVAPVENRPIKSLDENETWKTYVRRSDHTLLANKILVRVWKEQKLNHSKPQEFGEDELLLLKILGEQENCTLSKLYRISKLNKSKVDHLLVLFICWDIVEMKMSEEGTFYLLKD